MTITEIPAAVAAMRALHGDMWSDLGPHFTCTEAEVLHDLFEALDLDDHAEGLMICHAEGDTDEEDRHEVVKNEAGDWVGWRYR